MALRHRDLRPSRGNIILRCWRYWPAGIENLSSLRTQAICRLHAELAALIPGGISRAMTATIAARALARIAPSSAVETARMQLASDLLADVRRLDTAIAENKKRASAFPSGLDGHRGATCTNLHCKKSLEWPTDGIVQEVAHSETWFPDWGERPEDPQEAASTARARLATAPKLVPHYGHRYLPTLPSEAGNPVLSCYQTDVIYYGTDLLNWFECEFGQPKLNLLVVLSAGCPFGVRCWQWE